MGADGTEGELIERIAAAVAGKLGVSQARPTLTWRQLWALYTDAEAGKLASWDTVIGRAKHVTRIIGDDLVVDAGLPTVKLYRAQRKTEITVRKGAPTPTTINREVELILRMARWASRQKPPHIPRNPFDGLERDDVFVAVENVRRNVVEDNPDAVVSLDALLLGADLFEVAFVLTAHCSGMRRKELALMERSWIDRVARIIEVPTGVAKGRRGHRKGRQTFITLDALAAIDAYHESLPFPWRYRSPYVFSNPRNGDHYEPGYFSIRFRALAERNKVIGPSGRVWLHDAGRRSMITLARRRGEDTSNIMQASGHRTLKAFQRYDIHSRADAIVVRERIEAARARELAALDEHRRSPQRAATLKNFNASQAVDKNRQR